MTCHECNGTGLRQPLDGSDDPCPACGGFQFPKDLQPADMVTEFRKPYRTACPGCGLQAWFASDETGMSSKYLAEHLGDAAGMKWRGGWTVSELQASPNPFPHDADDFHLCQVMLEACPELRQLLVGTMSDPKHGSEWNRLAACWTELEARHNAGQWNELSGRIRELTV